MNDYIFAGYVSTNFILPDEMKENKQGGLASDHAKSIQQEATENNSSVTSRS
jgi:hypothetical protein